MKKDTTPKVKENQRSYKDLQTGDKKRNGPNRPST